MENAYSKFQAILGTPRSFVREKLGTPDRKDNSLDVYRRGDCTLVLFYQQFPEIEELSVAHLVLYDDRGKVLYADDKLNLLSRDSYDLFAARIPRKQKATPDQYPSWHAIEGLCGAAAADNGSGRMLPIYATDFGKLVCLSVVADRIISMTLCDF